MLDLVLAGMVHSTWEGDALVRMNLNELKPETAEYLQACARIRDVNTVSLVRRLLNVIAEDCMVSAILDDGDSLRERHKGEHRYRGEK